MLKNGNCYDIIMDVWNEIFIIWSMLWKNYLQDGAKPWIRIYP